jgi:hypothetical protein
MPDASPSPWVRAFERGEAAHPGITFDAGSFERRLRAALTRRLAPLGLAPDEVALAALLERTAVEDLWLAQAVEACAAGAETRLRSLLGPALEAAALKRGLVAARARTESARVIESVLGSPGAVAPDRLGGYDGSADLKVWLLSRIEEGEQARAAEPAPGEQRAEPPEPARPHPSALFLAAAAQGRLLAGELDALLRHVPGCARCAEHLKGLALAGYAPVEAVEAVEAGEATSPASDPTLARGRLRSAGPPPSPKRAGALLLGIAILCGVVVLAMRAGGGRRPLLGWGADDTERAVHEAARRLAQREPGFFADFVPYPRDQLENAPTRPPRGDGEGIEPLHPLDEVLSDRPTLLWRPVAGATRYAVAVRTSAGDPILTVGAAAARLEWPKEAEPLARDGRYEWEVRVEGADVLSATAKFRVVSDRQQQHWERRRARIEEHVREADARAVLLAQVALQRGHVWEAWQGIRAHVARVPGDRYGQAFAEYLKRMHSLE